jgi:hypothetical protein
MLQEQRGDFVEIDYFSHCSPPYRRTEGIRYAVGREGIPAAERIHINHGEPPKRGAACERSLLPAWKSAQANRRRLGMRADAEHRPCYTEPMLKRSLNRTNPYLLDPAKRHAMFQMTVYTSTDIEGVKLTQSDLLAETRAVRRITSRESAKSSRSPR